MFPRGSEAVPGASLSNAEANIAEFIQEIFMQLPEWTVREPTVDVVRLPDYDGEGRFAFALTFPVPGGDPGLTLVVLMPGLPLEEVNFGARVGDWPTSFPRLYLDGASWLWSYAVGSAAGRLSAALRPRG